jgi:hypothetical protein
VIQSTFAYLDGREGLIKVSFYSSFNGHQLNSFDISIRDPTYVDKKVVSLCVKDFVDLSSGQWSINRHKITYTTFWKQN